MGHPSSLRYIPASSSATPIDWTRVSEETKKFIERYGYDWDAEKYKPLPATIGDLAKMFDDTKFFGYFQPSLVTVLMDISEFGLKPKRPKVDEYKLPVGPRFYMKYLEQVWFFLFAPGTRHCVVGYSHDINRNGDPEKMAADETALAMAFDVKLEQEVSGGLGKGMVSITNKLAGWSAMMAQSSLEYAQHADEILALHPSYSRYMEAISRTH